MKPEIKNGKVIVEGRSWDVIEVDLESHAVHLINGDDGICIDVKDEKLLQEISALVKPS